MPRQPLKVGLEMKVVFVHSGQGMRDSRGIVTAPYTSSEHITEQEIEEDAEAIYFWLFSSVPGSVLDKLIDKLTEK